MHVSCLFSSKMGDIGKREAFPLVLHYGEGKAAIEQKPCFQIQNAAHFPNWSSWLLHSSRNWFSLGSQTLGRDFHAVEMCAHCSICVECLVLQAHEANCMCAANEPGILHVRQHNWRDFEIALVLWALSGPKGQLGITGLLDISRYVSLGRRDKAGKTREPR